MNTTARPKLLEKIMMRFANKFGSKAVTLKVIQDTVQALPNKRLNIADINALEIKIQNKLRTYDIKPLPQIARMDNRMKDRMVGPAIKIRTRTEL